MSLMMSASGFPCIEGDFPSPIHFCEEERKQAVSDKRIIEFLSCFLLASSSARHAAPNSALWRSCLPRLFPVGSNHLCVRPV